MPTFADLLTPGLAGADPSQDQPDNPDEQPPSRSRSTATPPVGQGPMETTVTPSWDTSGANGGGMSRIRQLAHELGVDRDYLKEARSLLPAPPPAATMNKGSWAALAIPAAVAALTGGPMGLAAAGNAVGQAGVTNAQQKRLAYEDQLKHATSLASLAGSMQQRGTQLFNAIAPYEGMRSYDAARIQEEDLTRAARVAQWHEQNVLTDKRLSQDLTKFAQTEQDKALSREETRARDEANAHYHEAQTAYQAGHLTIARQALQLAQQREADANSYRSQMVDIAIQNATTRRDATSMAGLRSVLASLTYELQTLEPLAATDTSAAARVNTLKGDIDKITGALQTAPPAITPPAGTGGAGGGAFSGMTFVGTDSRSGHPVYKNAQGQYVDGVTGQPLQ